MGESRFDEKVLRPMICPFCESGNVDPAVSTVVTEQTFWRCRECHWTWTIADPGLSSAPVH